MAWGSCFGARYVKWLAAYALIDKNAFVWAAHSFISPTEQNSKKLVRIKLRATPRLVGVFASKDPICG